jgi:hypothetical protein
MTYLRVFPSRVTHIAAVVAHLDCPGNELFVGRFEYRTRKYLSLADIMMGAKHMGDEEKACDRRH